MDKQILCKDRNGNDIHAWDLLIRLTGETYTGWPLLQVFQALDMRSGHLWVKNVPIGLGGDIVCQPLRQTEVAVWGDWPERNYAEPPIEEDLRVVLDAMRELGADV